MTVHLGIDLGTTYSTVAAWRNGRVELLSLGTRSAAVPSVVFVRDGAPPLVGEAAEARAQGDPSRFAREFKRRLGDPTPLILGGVPMGAERLSADVLAYLVERGTERVGEAPASIVLTHPASYTQYRLDLLGEAANPPGPHHLRPPAAPPGGGPPLPRPPRAPLGGGAGGRGHPLRRGQSRAGRRDRRRVRLRRRHVRRR